MRVLPWRAQAPPVCDVGGGPGHPRILRIVAFLGVLALAGPGLAATRRALLVGINEYVPGAVQDAAGRRWTNLEGAVNDVAVMREILVARYGFAPENVVVLQNAAATRAAILEALRHQLVHPVQKGDVCVFYYAGHGSQVQNTDCPEGDCRDETIVPADANLGAADIRDKELQRLFNDALDRGAVLTVIFDSCYSGSIVRGLASPTRTRALAADPRPVPRLLPDPRGAPDARGALVFTASQEFQPADEVLDEQGLHHGLFSMALARALRSGPVREPARDVFRRVRAIMASSAWRPQEPRLEGTPARLGAPPFVAASETGSRTTVAVERLERDGICVLQGGLALGLCTGSELRRLVAGVERQTVTASAAGVVDAAPVRLRVESIEGPNRCTARVIAGDARGITVGDLFEPDVWAGCGEPFLRIWMPPPTLTCTQLEKAVHDLAPLRAARAITWIEDPTETTPTHVLAFAGDAWTLTAASTGVAENLGAAPTAASVLQRLRASAQPVRLFLLLPPPAELATALGLAPQDPRSPIDVTPDRAAAHYLLAGRLQARGVEYAWMRPNVSGEASEAGWVVLPWRSDWCALDAGGGRARVTSSTAVCAQQLGDLVLRIGKVRAWLQLEGPPEDGRFPYKLGVLDPATGRIAERTTFHAGERLQMALWADPESLRQHVAPRYTYVFAIDCNGKIETIFPRENETNYVPYSGAAGNAPPALVSLDTPGITVAPPYGIDTFILLTMSEPLPDPAILSGAPVKTRDASRETPLAQLLAGIGSGTRGIHAPTPADWSVQRLFVRSAPESGGSRR